ncbi:hypothetical protein M413DRAFT_74670 [Hebeloma cylindrosporum]|uniref:Protein ARV n=1 Tax=Hebeloma cylindrosporum TaxID=76867 RepID=A0A0C2XPK7_HEBCY|nr:hypothetical protein M413DRAFT_74670 [Hebeloma cylindrosporum h7]
MPICTSCTALAPYLYTVYETEYNLRLEQCPSCHAFVDPYVEHDPLTILLDLILLKRGVYRHLLYNRGAQPRRLTGRNSSKEKGGEVQEDGTKSEKELDRWLLVFQLGCALILVDACNYLSALPTSKPQNDVELSTDPDRVAKVTRWTHQSANAFLRVFLGTAAETVAFHGGITLACYIVMKATDFVQTIFRPPSTKSNIRQEFRLSLIPLSLFYSSITKLFLLFLLTIWLPTSNSHSTTPPMGGRTPLPEWTKLFSNNNQSHLLLTTALEMLDDDKLDREWIVRNVLGGMSAGFGLRVILDIYPLFTTFIILFGWFAKTFVAALLSSWVGGDESTGEAWLAYSIP